MTKIRIIISTFTSPHMTDKKFGSSKGLRCLTAGVSLLASADAMAGGEPTPEEVLKALNAQVVATQERVEQVCGEKDRLVAEAKVMRAAGKKMDPDQRKYFMATLHGCSAARADLAKEEADQAEARAAASGVEADEAERMADASFQKLVKSMGKKQ